MAMHKQMSSEDRSGMDKAIDGKSDVVIVIEDQNNIHPQEQAQLLSNKTGFPIVKAQPASVTKARLKKQKHNTDNTPANIAQWQLVYTETALVLRMTFEPSWGDIKVDFLSEALKYRKDRGGGKNEAIAKAIGIKSQSNPSVLDCTAGMGNDSFVMASVGADVTMLERSEVVASLLADAMFRANNASADDVIARLSLIQANAIEYLQDTSKVYDVIYLDPMFPHKKKSALVKKEMRAFQQLLGADNDSEALLHCALQKANSRVVVKRPNYASAITHIDGRQPDMAIVSKKHRFDVYIKHNN